MAVVQVMAKVVEDDSGIHSEIPILINEHGVVRSLLDYLLDNQHLGSSWQRQVVQSTKLLIEYMEANQHHFADPRALFQSFASKLYSGTIGDDGLDPSGLGWIPASTMTSKRHIDALKGFTDHLAESLGVAQMNPLVAASSHDQRLNYAAWHRRNEQDFLGHIKDKSLNDTVSKARNLRGRRALSSVDDDSVAFPERLFQRFYVEGFGYAKDRRCCVRDQLILLMMHGAGVRESDALHLWVHDVEEDPDRPGSAIVRLYHPEDGKAPDRWKARSGKSNRAAYLRDKYALTPRNRLQGTQRVGWKTRLVDDKDNYIQLHWFPPEFGLLFLKLWKVHLRYLATVERNHPYAFVSYEKNTMGQPYSLPAFNGNYGRALVRIGSSPAKPEGRSPHGHRHAYGRRVTAAGVNPIIIRKAMHHRSMESQKRYTTPGITQMSLSFDAATERLNRMVEAGEIIRPLPAWESSFNQLDDDSFGSIPSRKHFRVGKK